MEICLWLLIFLINIIFALSKDVDNIGDNSAAADEIDAEDKVWPEKTFSSSETLSGPVTATDDKVKKKIDPFWDDPLTYFPPWLSLEVVNGESRFPFYDASYPIWIPGFKYKERQNAPKLQFLQRVSSNEDALPEKVQLKGTFGESNTNKMDDAEMKQYKAEMKAGDMTRFMGINQHRYQPDQYHIYDLGRRFVPQYPYHEIIQNDIVQEEEDPSLIPKKAPPELVLAIAEKFAAGKFQAAEPINPNDEVLKKESLRSGNYWNAYWKEEVDDSTAALRSSRASKLDTIAAKLSPGTPIYEYVSKLNKFNPKLLYVINKKNDD